MIEDKSMAMKVSLMCGDEVLETRPVLMEIQNVEDDKMVVNVQPVSFVSFNPAKDFVTGLNLVDDKGNVLWSKAFHAPSGSVITWGSVK